MAAKQPKIKYSPSWCDAVLELGRQGLVLSSYAASLGLSVNQLQAVMKAKPEFAEAVEVAMSFALSFHEQQLALANQTKGSQPQLTLAFLKSNWPSKYNADQKSGGGRGEKQGELVSSDDMIKAIAELFEDMVRSSDPDQYTKEHKENMLVQIGSVRRLVKDH